MSSSGTPLQFGLIFGHGWLLALVHIALQLCSNP
jgi:hypothetical protein